MICSDCVDMSNEIDRLTANYEALIDDVSHITNSEILSIVEVEMESIQDKIEYLRSEIESCGCDNDSDDSLDDFGESWGNEPTFGWY